MTKTWVFLTMGLTASLALASTEPSYELSCRAKAKEVAAESYRGCVTDYKTAEIDHLRKDYQNKLKALKGDYEKEIEKLGGKTKSKSTTVASTSKKPARPTDDDGAVEVHAANPAPATSDDSRMDLPEPIPVDSPSSN